MHKGYFVEKGKPLLEIDGHGKMASGEVFQDERDLKELLLKREQQFARTIVDKLMTIGRPMTFRDVEAIQEILSTTSSDDYCMRKLILGVVSSDAFAIK